MISLLYLVAALAAGAGESFTAKEEQLLAAASTNDRAALTALAGFYAAHDLWPETLAALARSEGGAMSDALLAARADYELGRYSAALRLLKDRPDGAAMRAMAYARLGAYQQALDDFARSGQGETLPSVMLSEYRLMRAEASILLGDIADAEENLAALEGVTLGRDARFEKALVEALLIRARGDKARSAAALQRLANEASSDAVMRARLLLAEDAKDLDMMQSLSLEWRGGAFEREARLAIGEALLARGDYAAGFAKLRGAVALYPYSLAAKEAARAIEKALPKLFSADSTLKPEDAARFFFDNVEFAPPGEEGDKLIHAASDKLVALGLYRQAGALLDHQVFKRLRGIDRSAVAADLADVWLAAKDPKAALTALRATRMAGLDKGLEERRRRLEATALAETDDRAGALALLEDAATPPEMRLRADIHWSAGEWGLAAKDYAHYFASSPAKAESDRDAAVRAATAYLLAGDRDGYRAFVKDAGVKLDGAKEEELIRTLGAVDREDFLDRFMETYRGLYGAKKS